MPGLCHRAAAFAALILLVWGCSGGNLQYASVVSFSLNAEMALGTTQTVTATGWPPHTFWVQGTAGTLGEPSGNSVTFTATSVGSVTITAQDSLRALAQTTITVKEPGRDALFNPPDGFFTFSPTLGAGKSPLLVETSSTQSDFVLVGGDGTGFQFLKISSSGTLLTSSSISETGIVDAEITSAAMVPTTQNILVAGWETLDASSNARWVFLRRRATDTLADTGFNGGSILAYKPDTSNYRFPRVWPFADGSYLVAGYEIDTGGNHFVRLDRFNADGSHGSNHQRIALSPLNQTIDAPPSLGVDSLGRIWLASHCKFIDDDVCVYLFKADGSTDTTLDGDGNFFVSALGNDTPSAVLIHSTDAFVVGGSGEGGLNYGFFAFSPTTSGVPDRFDWAAIQAGHISRPRTIIEAADKRLIAVGGKSGASPAFVAALFDLTMMLPTTHFTDSIGTDARGAMLLPNGQFLVAGTNGAKWVLARYWP